MIGEPERTAGELYDAEAERLGWRGPEVVFGLAFGDVHQGETIIDLGIGTGLAAELFRKAGLEVTGMDSDPEMLAACRAKGFTDLTRHDLTEAPYPFAAHCFAHAVCVGVLGFLRDPSPVFVETARLLRRGGLFAFDVIERPDHEAVELSVASAETGVGAAATLYRRTPREIRRLLEASGFALLRDVGYLLPIGVGRQSFAAGRVYVARKTDGGS